MRDLLRRVRDLVRERLRPFEYNTLGFQKSHWSESILRYDPSQARLFGYDWGDPESREAADSSGVLLGDYRRIKDELLLPFIGPATAILDLGCGGGKWTQYMLAAGRVHCVDLNDESFDYIRRKLPCGNVSFHKTGGGELGGIQDASIDFIFSMDVLVRTEKALLASYFSEFKRVLKGTGRMLLHLPCSDMPGSRSRRFVDLTRNEIRALCRRHGFENHALDDKTITHGVLLKINY